MALQVFPVVTLQVYNADKLQVNYVVVLQVYYVDTPQVDSVGTAGWEFQWYRRPLTRFRPVLKIFEFN